MPARRSFPPSSPARRPGMDDATRRLLYLAGGLALLLVAGMGTWSVMGRHASGIPVIEADTRPLRVKPENPGGMQVVGANEQGIGEGGGPDKMGPSAEAPDPQALRAQTLPPLAPAPQPAPAPAAQAAAQPTAMPAPIPASPPAAAGPAISPLP